MLRLGIVDFDSSHSVEFTRRINHVGVPSDQWVAGARVVAGCPGTSQMAPDRIAGFTPQIAACGVELVKEPGELIGRVDGVLVLSLSGQVHLDRARPFFEAGIPTFVDKPFACRSEDAREMIGLAEQHGVMLFSSSALRFCEQLERYAEQSADHGAVIGAVSHGPAWRDEGNPGLFHYGIHATEALYALLGPGCHSVSVLSTDAVDLVTARWKDGRLAVIRGSRQGATAYGIVAYSERSVTHLAMSTRYAYRNLCRRIVTAFEEGTAPVRPSESLEVVEFIEAALESERRGGELVALPTAAA